MLLLRSQQLNCPNTLKQASPRTQQRQGARSNNVATAFELQDANIWKGEHFTTNVAASLEPTLTGRTPTHSQPDTRTCLHMPAPHHPSTWNPHAMLLPHALAPQPSGGRAKRKRALKVAACMEMPCRFHLLY
jgi:hypothetical protein